MNRLIRACLVAALLCLIPSATASAARVGTFHNSFDTTFPATLCGIDVTIHATGVENLNITTDKNGNLLFQFTTSSYATLTNADGDWISLSAYGADTKDMTVVNNPDGGFTVTFAYDGVQEWLRDSSGATISRDVGRIADAFTFDANGNLVARSTTLIAGSHPEVDSGFKLFCNIISTYLG